MTLALNITDDLRPEEATELMEIAREADKPVGRVLLEAAREYVRQRREQRSQPTATPKSAKQA